MSAFAPYADRIIELKNGRIVSDTVAGFSQKEENLNSSNFVKSKLPFKSALKIGTGNFKLNKGKFITVVLLAVIAFSLLGSSFCFALFKADKAFVNYIYDKSDMEYFGIYKNLRFVDVGAGGGLTFLSNYVSYAQHEVPLTKDDINLLNKNTKDSVIPVNRSDTILTQSHWASTSEERQGFWNAGGRFEANSTGSAVLNTQSMEKLGYTIVGSLPKNKNEIAINQYTYYGFTIAGFKDIYGTVHPIDSPDDMIGLKIKTSNTLYNARQDNPDFLGTP